jgi:hypothetical protein
MGEVAIIRKPPDVEDAAASYNAIKEFGGRKYTGMRVGGSHSWYYRQGEWRETKVAPDRWEFSYAVNKLRKWDAPGGSGAPVGTEYHWYILAHQNARKLNANEYTTSMTGIKYKLAHRRADSEEWSASERAQLRRLITIFEENISQLQHELGEGDKEPRTTTREAEPLVRTTDKRRREMIGGRRMPPKNPPPSAVVAQPQLEMYMMP